MFGLVGLFACALRANCGLLWFCFVVVLCYLVVPFVVLDFVMVCFDLIGFEVCWFGIVYFV